MDYKGATSPLEQWVGLAIRDAKVSYRDKLIEEEQRYFAAGGVKKAGARTMIMERVASAVAVKLSEDFLAEADAVGADTMSVCQAQTKAMGFFDYVSQDALALSSYMHPAKAVLDATIQLFSELRTDFADRTDSFLSKRNVQILQLASDGSLSHRYDEVLFAVQARHIEIEEQFQAAGRGFDNDGFVTAQVAFANDRVMDFLRDQDVKAAVKPAELRATALQLHSEALARVYMGLRRNEFGVLRSVASECTDVFAAKRDEGIRRIISEIALLADVSNRPTSEVSKSLPSLRGYDDTALLAKIRADRVAGRFPNDWKACLHYEEQAEGSTTPEARARRLQEKLKKFEL